MGSGPVVSMKSSRSRKPAALTKSPKEIAGGRAKSKRMTRAEARQSAMAILKDAEEQRARIAAADAAVGAGWPFPQDGVYLVMSGDSRRISCIGDVPDPMDLAKLEVLRAAVEKRSSTATVEVPTKVLLDCFFKVFAREAHEQEVLESAARALKVEGEMPAGPTMSEAWPAPVSVPDGQTVVSPADFLFASPMGAVGDVPAAADDGRPWPERPKIVTVVEGEFPTFTIAVVLSALIFLVCYWARYLAR